ncbi:hypothetical protein QOZ80_3AG0243270 [Eleusine coracana subsp. coracana]|nr:hypothetical protein QOZ80_3AG0243270 [Eleusine coracana subsp. coracana]
MPLLLQLPAAAALPGVEINAVRDLLPFLQGVPVTYRFAKHSVELDGIVTASGYACACAASSSCGYSGKVLSALQFEKHAGVVSKNQNGHIFLRNGKSLYELFHALRLVAAEAFPEEFRAAAGVPMTVCAAGASPAPQGTGQGQQPGGMASWEPSGVQVHGVMAELPSAPTQEDVEMLTEEEEAGLCLLGLRESGSSTNSNPICGAQGPVTEEDAAGGDHAMPDVEEIRNVAVENGSGLSSLLAATPIKVSVGETRWQSERSRYQLESYLKDVRGLLTTGLLEGFKVIYRNNEVENIGRISGQGYSCGCSECGYSSQVLNACEFEQHSGESSCNQNDRIFLETGISLYRVVKALKHYKLNVLGEFIEEIIGFPPNMVEYNKWKDTLRKKDDLDALASDRCSTQRGSVVQEFSLANYLKESPSSSIANLNWSVFKRRSERHVKREVTETSTPSVSGSPDKGIPLFTGTSKKSDSEEAPNENIAGRLGIDGVKPDSPGPTAVTSDSSKHNPINLGMPLPGSATITSEPSPDHSIGSKSKEQKTRDTTLHPLLFKEGGLPDNTFLTYKLKNGEALKQGYKRGTYIVCNCCNQEFTPSHFEEHAGMGRRRQPYKNIYTAEGLTLHKLALQLQDHLNSNGFDKANICGFDDYPILTSPGFGKESSTPSGPIVPLKRTLQERVVETESCYFCGDGSTTIGKIDAEMIVFCNQCERPCHVKCYNNLLEKKKSPLKVLEEYMQFCFLCCEKCQLLRARLDEGLEKCEDIAFLRQIGSNICWRILCGMNASNDVCPYMPQIIDIFKDAFSETTAEHIDVIAEMVKAKDVDGEKDFRGMFCAALTVSAHVVSTAILKVQTEEVAELVLVATRRECRKKGYFVLLLKSIETYLRACNVKTLTAPVDPEMVPIWSEKLGFTILSAEEKKSMLEVHPLVMFENLLLVQKSLA